MSIKILKICVPFISMMILSCSGPSGKKPKTVRVVSPDGKNTITAEISGKSGTTPLTFAVARSGKTVIEPSALKIVLEEKKPLTDGSHLVEFKEDLLDETFSMPWGKSAVVRNDCSQALLRLKNAEGVLWNLELRAYDDGVAFRYSLPVQDGLNDFVLEEEATEFRLAGNPSVLFTSSPEFNSSHEYLYQRKLFSELPTNTLIDIPLLAVWPEGISAALLEAGLRDFAGMYLEQTVDRESPVLRVRLSPLPSGTETCVVGQTPYVSPWRVILLSDEAGKHLESNLLVCLNDPPQGDYSWLQMGKTTWHWWNGTAEEGLPFRCGMNFETHKYYIDFCARNGIAFHAIVADDRPWYKQTLVDFAPSPDTDLLTPRPELEFPKLLRYAEDRGVGVRLWVHWQPLMDRLEEVFTLYEEWGIKGLMVDFLDRNDQEMVRINERILESAARHKLHIQFHGSYMPSGEWRTFPNLFNREGVLNLEYLKWRNWCTPQHNVNVAYTRLLAGPTDYHLGGFRSESPAKFKPRNIMPTVLGTRCHHLALYVVYDNPMPQVCDTPSSYEGQTGFEFLKTVPVTWDETRFLAGEAGEFVVVARRQDRTWYLGGITNQTKRDLNIPLNMLETGEYEAEIFSDGSMNEEEPNAINLSHQTVTTGTLLKVAMAPGGGFVASIRPR